MMKKIMQSFILYCISFVVFDSWRNRKVRKTAKICSLSHFLFLRKCCMDILLGNFLVFICFFSGYEKYLLR